MLDEIQRVIQKENAMPIDDSNSNVNPYGGGPGTGLQFPPYYQPTKSVRSRMNYFPGSETLGPDEMRISFVGSCPVPLRRDQAGTAIMVELGNGDRFFFDFGPGCLKNILAMGISMPDVNDIFLTHLHVDHFHDLSYLLPFSAWGGRWHMPLRVTGPSGRTPDLGTKAMVAGMKQMLKWHLEAFDLFPIGEGYEVEVNEFDWKDEYGICYEKNGVTIRHWRRSHAKDGASAYRLDWNGLSFVWTGDGRPDDLTAKYAKGVDVFVTELQPDLALGDSIRRERASMPTRRMPAAIQRVTTTATRMTIQRSSVHGAMKRTSRWLLKHCVKTCASFPVRCTEPKE
jgi:ribonuclease Z